MISRGELKPVQITPRRMGFRADEVSAFVGSLTRHTTPFPIHTKKIVPQETGADQESGK
jgi:hypothetical protein